MSANRFYAYEWRENAMPFYVGKGTGNRARVHETRSHNPIVQAVIQRAKRTGATVECVIVRDGLTEFEAFKLEAELNRRHGRVDNGTGILFNRSAGWEGWTGSRTAPPSPAPPPPLPPPRLPDFLVTPSGVCASTRRDLDFRIDGSGCMIAMARRSDV